MEKDYLVLKRASASRPSGECNDDDYDVLADGIVVGRIMKAAASPVGTPWMWTLAFWHHEDRTPTHGYAATRESAMAAFTKSWLETASAPGDWLSRLNGWPMHSPTDASSPSSRTPTHGSGPM
jgi:hypothetical protein